MLYKRRGYPKRARKVAPKRKYTKRPKSGLRKIVNQIISQNIENKRDYNGSTTLDLPTASGAIPVLPYQQLLIPALTQGTGQGGRLGNMIKIKNSMLTIHLWAKPFATNVLAPNQVCKPQHIRVMVIRQKQLTVGATALTNISSFFQTGSTSSDFAGTLVDISREINKDVFTVKYDRTFKVCQAAAGTQLTSPGFFVPNNDYKLNQCVKIPIGKMMKQNLRYDDSNLFSRCTNDNLFLVMQTVNFDNTGPNIDGLTRQISFEFEIHTEYEDA